MMTMTKRVLMGATALATAVCGASFAGAADAPQFFQLINELPLKSTATAVDHVDYNPATKMIYLSRRKDGVTVVDATTQKVVAQIAKSEGSNAVALVPKHDRGYTGNGDGTTTIFKLSDNSLIDRVSLATNSDGGIYEPVTDQVAFQIADDSIMAFIDAATGKKTGELKVEGEELERPVPDGKGNIYLPLRDKSTVYKIDAKTHSVVAHWDVSATCQQPSGTDYDPATNRLFVGCRGNITNPLLTVLDGTSGAIVAKMPIGRGCDEVVFDAKTKQIFTANGVDGNIVIYKEIDGDHYTLQEAFGTRPGARNLRYDPSLNEIFIMANNSTFDPSKKNLAKFNPWYANTIFPDSLSLLTYGYKPAK